MAKSTKNKVEDGRLVRPVKTQEITHAHFPGDGGGALEVNFSLKQDIVPVQVIGRQATWELPGNQRAELEVRFDREVLTVTAFFELGGGPRGANDTRALNLLIRSIRHIQADLDAGVPLKARIDEVKKQFAAWLRAMEARYHPELSHEYTFTRH